MKNSPSPLHYGNNHLSETLPFVRDKAKLEYRNRLEVEYHSLLENHQEVFKPSEKVVSVLETPSRQLTWAKLFYAERVIFHNTPEAVLRAKRAGLIADYVRIAPPEELELARSSGSLEANPDDEKIRISTVELLSRLQHLRSIGIRRETIKNAVSLVVAIFGAALFASIWWYVSTAKTSDDVSVFQAIVICGCLGGFISAQTRIQAIPEARVPRLNDLSILRLSGGITFAIVSGAIGAVFLYILLLCGAVKGDIFPHIALNSAEPEEFTTLRKFIEHSIPQGESDMAKLLLWSFIAGFSERLVPDQVFFLGAGLTAAGKSSPKPN